MRVIIDAMGGDNAPAEIVKGAVWAQKDFDIDIILVGREDEVRACLKENGAENNERISVVNADEVITMHDDPATATRRKKNSSMTVALNMVRDGEGDACLSAGSTGALLTGATLITKRIRGIRRAALSPVLPNGGKGVVLIDCGANVECTPEYLLQFAYMGSFYAGEVLGIENPRVALLNNGAEDSKGTPLHKETYQVLKEAGERGRINFVGNVEAGNVFANECDVIVTDGFSGNILLKSIEGTAKFLMKNIKGVFTASLKNKLAAAMVIKEFKGVKKMLDVSEVGGTAMLGITKPVIKAHGSSDAKAIRSAVRQAIAFVESGITEKIAENIEYMQLREDEE
ncbi:MAG: phosphate acyltransferase PlsX [Oscillospiraceae bacterium]|nr:phosphate acyltransferase PlsX [Oscillospiraceae bacterium]